MALKIILFLTWYFIADTTAFTFQRRFSLDWECICRYLATRALQPLEWEALAHNQHSIVVKARLCAEYSRSSTTSHVFIELALCMMALSCWNMFGTLYCSGREISLVPHANTFNTTVCFPVSENSLRKAHMSVMVNTKSNCSFSLPYFNDI